VGGSASRSMASRVAVAGSACRRAGGRRPNNSAQPGGAARAAVERCACGKQAASASAFAIPSARAGPARAGPAESWQRIGAKKNESRVRESHLHPATAKWPSVCVRLAPEPRSALARVRNANRRPTLDTKRRRWLAMPPPPSPLLQRRHDSPHTLATHGTTNHARTPSRSVAYARAVSALTCVRCGHQQTRGGQRVTRAPPARR
jgi:hypothetical protein